jgi:hypothetical protein
MRAALTFHAPSDAHAARQGRGVPCRILIQQDSLFQEDGICCWLAVLPTVLDDQPGKLLDALNSTLASTL